MNYKDMTSLQKAQRITELIKELRGLGVSQNRLQQVVQFRDILKDLDIESTEADYQTWDRHG